jgi:mannosyltransferase OCH1-like enzyme
MIPKNIFQTFKHKAFSKDFQRIVDTWKQKNPDFKYYLFDDEDCEKFIKSNFETKIYNAYCKIIPGAYKADLWRYCILYVFGGVYIDIDTMCFSPISQFLTEDIEFMTAVDLNLNNEEGTHNLFNTFIATVPRSTIMFHCIQRVVHNVENNIIPNSKLDFAGPGVLGRAVNTYLKLPEESSFVGKEGRNDNLYLLKFEKHTEFVKDVTDNILFQNKNGNPYIKILYTYETTKAKTISWLSSKPF